MKTHGSGDFGKTAALVAAVLGWLFDGFEMGLFPLIGGPAIKDLLVALLSLGLGGLIDGARGMLLGFGLPEATVTTLLFGAGLAGVTLLGTWGSIQWIPRWAMQLGGAAAPHAKEYSQIATALGAIIATYATALVADRLGRRPTFAMLCLATIAAALWLYQGHDAFGPSFLAAASARRSMGSFRSTSRSCFRRPCGRPGRGSRSTLGASSPRSAACRRPR